MSVTDTAKRIAFQPSPVELLTHASIVALIVICATVLGISHDLSSGDVLAIYTAAISGTAAVAGARSGNRSQRRTDTDNHVHD